MNRLQVAALVGLAAPFALTSLAVIREARASNTRPRAARATDILKSYSVGSKGLTDTGFVATNTATNAALANIIFLFAYWGYAYGFSAIFWVLVFWGAGFFASNLVLRSQALKNLLAAHGNSSFSMVDLVYRSLRSPAAAIAVAIATVIAFTMLLALELGVGSNAVASLVQLTRETSVSTNTFTYREDIPQNIVIGFVFATLIAIYTYQYGFDVVVATDKMQFFAIILSLIAIFYVLFVSGIYDFWVVMGNSLGRTGFFQNNFGYWSFVVGSLFSWGFWFCCMYDQWQRIISRSAALNAKEDLSAATWSILAKSWGWLALVTAASVLIGVAVKETTSSAHPPAFPVVVFLLQVAQHAAERTDIAVALCIILTGFLCAILSTADTYMVVVASAFMEARALFKRRNFYRPRSLAYAQRQLAITKTVAFSVPIVAMLWYTIAILVVDQNNFTLYMLAGSIPLTILPIFISAFIFREGKDCHRRIQRTKGISLAVGCLVAIFATFCINFFLANRALSTFDPKYFAALYFIPLIGSGLAGIVAAICFIVLNFAGRKN